MSRYQTRCLAAFFMGLAVFAMLWTPLMAGPGGNSEAAAACRHGGYRTVTDEAGNPFRNSGQCVRYVARGGTLLPVSPVATLTVTDNVIRTNIFGPANDFLLSGSGFLPNAALLITFETDTGYTISFDHTRTDALGNTANPWGWGCAGGYGTVNHITVTDGTNTAHTTQAILCQ